MSGNDSLRSGIDSRLSTDPFDRSVYGSIVRDVTIGRRTRFRYAAFSFAHRSTTAEGAEWSVLRSPADSRKYVRSCSSKWRLAWFRILLATRAATWSPAPE